MWEVTWCETFLGITAPWCQVVGPCKTAYDAWRMSKLKGGFGDYVYEACE